MTILISVENKELRDQIVGIAKAEHCAVRSFHSARELLGSDLMGDMLILETNDDVAALVQTVYEVRNRMRPGMHAWRIGMLSTAQMNRNPAVCRWLIDGRAALLALFESDSTDLYASIRSMIKVSLRAFNTELLAGDDAPGPDAPAEK